MDGPRECGVIVTAQGDAANKKGMCDGTRDAFDRLSGGARKP